MKRIILALIFVVLLSSIASAEIIINQQPLGPYALGDYVQSTITITTISGTYGFLETEIICDGQSTKLPDQSITIAPGEEKRIENSLLLIDTFIGKLSGACQIKLKMGEEYKLTEEFKISNLIILNLTTEEVEFSPDSEIIIEGKATKENGLPVNGFIDLTMAYNLSENSKTYSETINNGFFSIKFNLPAQTKAGQYLVNLNAYEKDPLGEKTNNGFTDMNIKIMQIPTSLEVIFETAEIEPGTKLKVKAILHDQTGENIPTIATITIKDHKDKILEQIEIATDEFLEYPINYNEPPAEFKVFSISNKLSGESVFNVFEKQDIKIDLINETILLTNIGNVPYCGETILIKIGEETFNLDPCLDVDKSQEYKLSAPDGEYQIEVINNGESLIDQNLLLTGKAIDIKESGVLKNIWNNSMIWIFLILVLGIIVIMIFKKGYKRSFIGKIYHKKKSKTQKNNEKEIHHKIKSHKENFDTLILESKNKKKNKIKPENVANLSLSMEGQKQNVTILNLKIKNLEKIRSSRTKIMLSKDKRVQQGSVEETIQKIINTAEERKAHTYINQDNIFFIFAPGITKTFHNEMPALEIAQEMQRILTKYNKLFKQKLSYGISLNNGEIIAKREGKALTFMPRGNVLITSKKISTASNEKVYLSETIRGRLASQIKTEKVQGAKINIYTLKDFIRKDPEHKVFLTEFVKRLQEKENKDK